MAYILAVDLGSTQMKLMLMDEKADTVAVVSEQYPTAASPAGWLEQNPKDWERALKSGILRLRQAADVDQTEVISFSGHMSGVVLLDTGGNVLGPCILLSDSRGQRQSGALMKSVGERVKVRTGNPVNTAFSLPKLLWLKEERPEIYRQTAFWLSPKDYIRYCLTEEIATEYTDAYNSLCIRRDTFAWDEEIINESGLDRNLFSTVYQPGCMAGRVTKTAAGKYGLKEGIPVAAGAADMACAVLGSGLSQNGDTALTLGTCATFFSIVQQPDSAFYGQVTFHPLAAKEKMYALGSHINGGAAVNWISAMLSEDGNIDYKRLAKLSEKACKVPAGSGGLMTIPFLNGSGSPYFCASDRQHVLGMRMNTSREALFRSQLEGISYNLRQSLLVFEKMANVKKLMIGGGGIHIRAWIGVIRDVFGIPVEIFDHPDVSATGAALIGGAAAGIFESPERLALQKRKMLETQMPDRENHELYKRLYEKYLAYYEIMHEMDGKEQRGERTCI